MRLDLEVADWLAVHTTRVEDRARLCMMGEVLNVTYDSTKARS